jgi:cytochrome c
MRRLHACLVSGLTLMPFAAPAAGEETSAGQLEFNNACRTCHSVRQDDNRLGPSLHGVVGRKSGSLAGYPYSETMKKSDLVWDEATLDRFIAHPDEVVSGNKMKPFGGIAAADERAKIIAFLKGTGKP